MIEASRSHESHQMFERQNRKSQVNAIQEDNFALICSQIDKINISMNKRMDQIERKIENQGNPHHSLRASYEPNHSSEEAHWIQRNPNPSGHHSQFHSPTSSFPPQSSWNSQSQPQSHDKSQYQPQSDSFQNFFEKIKEFQVQQIRKMEERQNQMFQELRDEINQIKTSQSSNLPSQTIPNPNSKPSSLSQGKSV